MDKKDPSKVLARSREPLVRPEPTEREGYVPNVVYTCGAMRHGDQIILPYAISDTFSNFATIKIAALMQAVLQVAGAVQHLGDLGAHVSVQLKCLPGDRVHLFAAAGSTMKWRCRRPRRNQDLLASPRRPDAMPPADPPARQGR